ncbi:YcgL domain-containing protein [Halothiobacillus sp. DCM-1]|uniref:YcgL domain-containing protein n=1 Tax=Halothiobacillus sp. DCM-1 TaxID=3112558 RepID=UPI003254810E
MQCTVYKSLKKSDWYLFVPHEVEPAALPEAIVTPLLPLERVMALDLTRDRPLARTDTRTLRQFLSTLGFYVQLPPGQVNWAHWDNLKAGISGQGTPRI